jgi:hypothetical protein
VSRVRVGGLDVRARREFGPQIAKRGIEIIDRCA